jgi:hypothetical protein
LGANQIEEHPHGGGCQVDTVTDHLEDRLTPRGGGQARADWTWRAVVQGRHTVEDVGDQRPSTAWRRVQCGAKCGPGGLGVTVGVADGGQDGVGAQHRRESLRAGTFGSEGHLGDRVRRTCLRRRLRQRLDQTRVHIAEGRWVLGAAALHRQERPLQMYAGEVASGDQRGAGRHPAGQRVMAVRDQAGHH